MHFVLIYLIGNANLNSGVESDCILYLFLFCRENQEVWGLLG